MENKFRRYTLGIVVLLFEIVFLVLFGLLVDYHPAAKDSLRQNAHHGEKDAGEVDVNNYYAMFQDVHVMMFIGFGFLMTFLKRYGFGSVGFNLLIAAFVLQWATLMGGFLHISAAHPKITVDITTMLTSDFASAAVLISFGAVLGKVGPVQLLFMAFIEIALFTVNEWIGIELFHASDMGGSMFVHVFGAYFGIAVARVLYNENVAKAEDKEGSVYHSDIFSMIGTVFLWVFWPSFNSALASGDDRQRAVLNTYYSLAACTVVTFGISALVNKEGKLDMVHVQNATLAGGVAVGTCSDMMIHPYGAMLIGAISAIISVLGYKFFTPCLTARCKTHDTCGVNNLHGMPGVFAGICGIVAAALATPEVYGNSLYVIFPARTPAANSTELWTARTMFGPTLEANLGWSAGRQAGMQAAALGVTLGIALVGGLFTGLLLRMPCLCDPPEEKQIFDDTDFWETPDDGMPLLAPPHVNSEKYTSTDITKV